MTGLLTNSNALRRATRLPGIALAGLLIMGPGCTIPWDLNEEFPGDVAQDVAETDAGQTEADASDNSDSADDPSEDIVEDDTSVDVGSDVEATDDVGVDSDATVDVGEDSDSGPDVVDEPDSGPDVVDEPDITDDASSSDEFCGSGFDEDGDGDADCDDSECTTTPVCGGFPDIGDYFETTSVDLFVDDATGEFDVTMSQQFQGTWVYILAVDAEFAVPGATSFTTDALFDSFCYLVDPDLGAIVGSDDDGGEGSNCRLDLTAAESLLYDIVIVDFNGTQVRDLPTLYTFE